MKGKRTIKFSQIFSLLLIAIIGLSNFTGLALAAEKERIKTITVTVDQKGHSSVPALDPEDFLVYEDGIQQKVISVSPATVQNAPLNIAIVIQEGLPQVNSEMKSLKKFIQGLPDGSQVMVAYINGGFMDIRQSFTTDLNKAAGKLRIVSSTTSIPASPYLSLIDVMKRFNGLEQGRNEILFISSGLDPLNGVSSTPTSNLYLEKAIKVAQQENITIFSLFAPSLTTRRTFIASRGQDSLNYLSEQTGGHAFLMGTSGFVTFDAPLADLSRLLNQQYVIAYKSQNTDKDFHRVKVTTDYSNIKVTAIKGYKSRS
jgi:VWFA-related protein